MQNPGKFIAKEYARFNDYNPVQCECYLTDGMKIVLNESGETLIKNNIGWLNA